MYADPQRGLLGHEQREWLIHHLTTSSATWKVRDLEGNRQRTAQRRGVTGIVLLTADVHYTAAHHYDPARAAIGDFTPFWEFVSGPANAGAFGPNTLDGTFGPQAVFVHAPPRANTSPLEGYQHFGEVDIDTRTVACSGRPRYRRPDPRHWPGAAQLRSSTDSEALFRRLGAARLGLWQSPRGR